MSDQSSQEKTEQPTHQKLKKTKEEGQVARSKDLSTTITLLATLLTLKYSVGWFYTGLQDSFARTFANLQPGQLGQDDLEQFLAHNLMLFVMLLVPLGLTSLLVVVFSMIPGGWVFASKNFAFKASKLNPLSGLKRMFFSAQSWTDLFKSLGKILVLGLLAAYLARDVVTQLTALQRSDVYTAIAGALNLAMNTALILLVVFILFSLIDIPLQRLLFHRRLRMSKQEIKEEHKNQEGRPEVKARIRQVQKQMLHRQISKVIHEANVVIVNPQHYAVALRYDSSKAEAPYVIARGNDDTALYIRELAQRHGLDLVEIPPLARAIYFTTQVNQQIPTALYKAVAQVLTYVLQLKAWRQGRRRRPELPGNLPIPESLANRGLS